ncbi:LysR family transcriptional regulator [Candidatus Thalassolituus haligoni]|uniref:LysR family transcriptional regulator n=1 Tax=Candidatus Thalassolituus haligoni TaxID=3100113 RepID=UPI00351144A3|tara:strand:- start:1782 stop:2708 length:927 start_codon:yes stop_codon:yes gene_type:complete
MLWNLDDLPIFLAVAEHQGISSAADYLGMAKSSVSKAITRLEKGLGVRLFERNSRQFRITHEGEAFYQHSLAVLERAHETEAAMSALSGKPSGKLVVSMPMSFGREIFSPHLARFRQLYPDIELELNISSQSVDVIRDSIDIAVVVGAPKDSELILKNLYTSQLLCVASPGYIQSLTNEILSPEDITDHIQVIEKRYANMALPYRTSVSNGRLKPPASAIKINDPCSVRDAVAAGCGIGLIPDQYCHRFIQDGQLLPILPGLEFHRDISLISAVYASRRTTAHKTALFLDFLGDICKQLPQKNGPPAG